MIFGNLNQSNFKTRRRGLYTVTLEPPQRNPSLTSGDVCPFDQQPDDARDTTAFTGHVAKKEFLLSPLDAGLLRDFEGLADLEFLALAVRGCR